MESAEIEQYRFHPAWKAALRHVKEQMEALETPDDIDTYRPYESGYGSGQYACIKIVDAEIEKTEV